MVAVQGRMWPNYQLVQIQWCKLCHLHPLKKETQLTHIYLNSVIAMSFSLFDQININRRKKQAGNTLEENDNLKWEGRKWHSNHVLQINMCKLCLFHQREKKTRLTQLYAFIKIQMCKLFHFLLKKI